jgi:hypothetical protein
MQHTIPVRTVPAMLALFALLIAPALLHVSLRSVETGIAAAPQGQLLAAGTIGISTEGNKLPSREISTSRKQRLALRAVKAIGLDPKPERTYAGLSTTQAEVLPLIHAAFGDELFPHAVRIAWCESRLQPQIRHTNRNGTTDHGLFQINDGGTLQGLRLSRTAALDPRRNSEAARALYEQRGWQPWTCHRKGGK